MARTLTLQPATTDPFDTGWIGKVGTSWTGVTLRLNVTGQGRRAIQLTRQIPGTTLQLFSKDVSWIPGDDPIDVVLGDFTGQIRLTCGLAAESVGSTLAASIVASGDIVPWDVSLGGNAPGEAGSPSNPYPSTTERNAAYASQLPPYVGFPAYVSQGAGLPPLLTTWNGGIASNWDEGGEATALLVGDVSQSPLGGAPLMETSDTVVATLGPTAQAQSTTEYNALKTGKIETRFCVSSILQNTGKVTWDQAAFLKASANTTCVTTGSNPWPQTNGTVGWWSKGGPAFYAQGEGTVAIAYTINNTNKATVLIDGKRLSGSDTAGAISNAVSSTGNALQWCSLVLTGNKRRLINIYVASSSYYSIVASPGVDIFPIDPVGKAIVMSDSFGTRNAGAGEVGKVPMDLAVASLRLLGYSAVNSGAGGTGFTNNGGGFASGKGSYLDCINQYIQYGVPLGFDPMSISAILLFGTGNDAGTGTQAAYFAVIEAAILSFPNAKVCISSVYEGFNTVGAARTLNDQLYAAVVQARAKYSNKRVLWAPVDSHYTASKVGVFSGTGSVPAPAGDGNADAYFSNATQGSVDRHPNNEGVVHGAQYYADALIRAGLPYKA